jgi:hypothetical protein
MGIKEGLQVGEEVRVRQEAVPASGRVHTKVLIAFADNVGSKQLQDIRKGLRGDSVVLMGKNTLIRLCIKVHAERTGNNDLKKLGELLVVSRLFFSAGLVRLYMF